jgi:hypothetical protein
LTVLGRTHPAFRIARLFGLRIDQIFDPGHEPE